MEKKLHINIFQVMNEWMCIKDGLIEFEDGIRCSFTNFFQIREDEYWDNDWNLWEDDLNLWEDDLNLWEVNNISL